MKIALNIPQTIPKKLKLYYKKHLTKRNQELQIVEVLQMEMPKNGSTDVS